MSDLKYNINAQIMEWIETWCEKSGDIYTTRPIPHSFLVVFNDLVNNKLIEIINEQEDPGLTKKCAIQIRITKKGKAFRDLWNL